ncbi:MAG: rRNA maturation RNase YbeY [Salinivirgaceae bacterium]|nr:rRNA maturation RNase YbeY [Salinivirgaceae bacterium]
MIEFFSEEVSVEKLNIKKTETWINKCVEEENKLLGDISVIFCNDEYLLQINKEYLAHHFYTDIITFDYSQDVILSGDLFISVDRVLENSKEFNVSFDNELKRVIIHGILHLIGYGDKTDEESKIMRMLENKYLKIY